MKVQIQRTELARIVDAAAGATPSKTSVATLANVMLEAGDAGLRATGTDLVVGASALGTANVTAPGRILVTASMLAATVKGLPDGEVSIRVDDSRLVLSSGKSRHRVPFADASEYPSIPTAALDAMVWIPSHALGAIETVAHSTIPDSTQPNLSAVRLEIDGGRITVVATDGKTLSLRRIECGAANLACTIPVRAVRELGRLAKRAPEVGLAVAGGYLIASASGSTVTAKLVDGAYMPYERVIPKLGAESSAVIVRADLLAALKRVSASGPNGAVHVEIGDGEVKLSVAEQGAESHDAVIAETSGRVIIKAATSFTLAAIAALTGDSVRIESNGPLHPITITNEGSLDAIEIVMPMQSETR